MYMSACIYLSVLAVELSLATQC